MTRFLDTNVLLYRISDEPHEQGKRDLALQALDSPENVLSTQVLQEFYAQATRSSRRGAISPQAAAGLVEAWSRFPVIETTRDLMRQAIELSQRRHWSIWDSAIVAAALQAGCDELWTEDLSGGQREGSLTIVNPFRAP